VDLLKKLAYAQKLDTVGLFLKGAADAGFRASALLTPHLGKRLPKMAR